MVKEHLYLVLSWVVVYLYVYYLCVIHSIVEEILGHLASVLTWFVWVNGSIGFVYSVSGKNNSLYASFI